MSFMAPPGKISQLPPATQANPSDQLEANQGGTSRSLTVAQVVNAAGQIGGYAPLASPVFVGNPQAPTPSPGDADTSVATTAFVQAAVAGGVNPDQYNAVGNGTTDDTAAFTAAAAACVNQFLVLNPRKTYALGSFQIPNNSGCMGIVGAGGVATIVPIPAATTGTFVVQIYRSDFTVDRIFFDGPIGTNPAVSPNCSTLLSFEIPTPTAVETDRLRVTNCRFRGSNAQLQFRNTSVNAFIWCQNNVFTDSWGASVNMLTGKQAAFSQNMFYHCGNNSVGQSQGVLVITTQNTVQTENVIVTNNIFRDCQIGVGQEAIDFASNGERNLLIAGNICDNVEHGFLEYKSGDTSAMAYGDIEICNNVVNFSPGLSGAGVTLLNITTIDHKHKKYKIHGNYFIDDSGTSTANGVSLGAHDNVTVDGNTFENVFQGVVVNAVGGATQTCFNATISGNIFNTRDTCIGVPARNVAGLVIVGNACVSTGKYPISLSGAASITGLRCSHNHFETTAASTQGVILSAINGGIFSHNTIVSTHVGTDTGTVNNSNLRIVHNDVTSVFGSFQFGTVGTGVTVAANTVTGGQPIITGAAAASVANWGNERDARSTTPQGAVAGALGDVVPNSAPAAGGIKEWICTTAGTSAAAVWKPVAIGP